jgi:hypothetical protein
MQWLRGAGGAVLVVVAVALGTAWTAGAELGPDPNGPAARHDVERILAGTISAPEATLGVAESALTVVRAVEPRGGPVWSLAGLAAALAAVCLLRRLRGAPVTSGHGRLLRDGVSRRGPPVFALA